MKSYLLASVSLIALSACISPPEKIVECIDTRTGEVFTYSQNDILLSRNLPANGEHKQVIDGKGERRTFTRRTKRIYKCEEQAK